MLAVVIIAVGAVLIGLVSWIYYRNAAHMLGQLLLAGKDAFRALGEALLARRKSIEPLAAAINKAAPAAKVALAPSPAADAFDFGEMQAENRAQAAALKEINSLIEKHPAIKKQPGFAAAKKQTDSASEALDLARRAYNKRAGALNELCASFPTSLVAKIKHIEPLPLFGQDPNAR